MISTTVKFSVSGNNYQEILDRARILLSEFFELSLDEVDSKIKIELIVTENGDSLDFEEDSYVADLLAKVRDV